MRGASIFLRLLKPRWHGYFRQKKEERTYGAANLKYSSNEAPGLRTEEMEKALLLSMILAYSQAF